jgi:hypothetical protein
MLRKSITKPICKYYNGYKKNQQLFTRPIYKYYNGCKKTNNYVQDLYVGIAYLKWPYAKDVGIAQCSFWSL